MIMVQDVYDLAVKLMNEQDDGTGSTDSSELEGYRNRSIALLNILVSDLYNLSDNTSFPAGSKPVPNTLTAFTDGIDLDDRLAVNVLPFGLAGYFKQGEDNSISQIMLTKYESLKKVYVKKMPTQKETVRNVYGSFSKRTDGDI